jgi:hypothetical protein
MRRFLLPGVLLAALQLQPAAAQDMGGVNLLPEALAAGGPHGLARPMRTTFAGIGAADIQGLNMPSAAERRQLHQQMIARVRGDGGFLDGFGLGQPLAASRQAPIPVDPAPVPIIEQIFAPTFNRNRTVIRNSFEAPVAVTVGHGNVVQQQGPQSGGTNAQQQVANIGGSARRSGGASNVIAPDGSIAQQAPGAGAGAPRHRRGGHIH